MGTAEKAGVRMVRRPIVPFAIILMITVASLGIIAVDPPSFSMNQKDFMPDDDMTRASAIISQAFTSPANVMCLVDAGNAGGDVLTKKVFIEVLGYERDLAALEYTDTDGNNQSYGTSLTGFTIISPVSAITSAITGPLSYDNMIAALSAMPDAVADSAIKTAAAMVLDPSMNSMASVLRATFTSDADLDTAITASGCMIIVMVPDNALDAIAGGQLGFERDVIGKASEFGSSIGLKVRAAGMLSLVNSIGELAQKDIMMLLPIAMILIIVLLVLIYRDVADTLVGLLGLLIAIIWTFAIASLMGIAMSTIAIAVPILIMGLGIDYSLHLVFRYREERMSGKDPMESVAKTLGSVGEALMLATVTTVIAFLSYLTSAMSALADFGVMCAIGITCAFGVMLLLVPPVQVMRDRRAERKGKELSAQRRYRRTEGKGGDILGKISGVGGKMAAKNPWAVLGAVGLIIVLCGYSATNLSYDFNIYDFIPEGTEEYETINYLNDNYASANRSAEILIYGDGWDLETQKAIELALRNVESGDEIDGILYQSGIVYAEHLGTALGSVVQRIAMVPMLPPVLGTMYESLYSKVFDIHGRLLIDSPTLIMDFAMLKAFALGTPGLNQLVAVTIAPFVGEHNGEPVTLVTLKMTNDVDGDNDAVIAMRDMVNEAFLPLADIGKDYVTTGQSLILASSMNEMNKSQMLSLFVTIAFVVVILTLFMYYTDRSWLLGAMATVPTLISVVMVWGTMAVMNMPLNVMTLTIASLAVGMGVTYGIHISHRYATELVTNDLAPGEAIVIATRETGKGVFAAALTTVAGFGVMGFSKILPMYEFGIITALAIGFGYIGSIFVLPSILMIWGKRAKPKLMQRMAGRGKKKNDAAFSVHRMRF